MEILICISKVACVVLLRSEEDERWFSSYITLMVRTPD